MPDKMSEEEYRDIQREQQKHLSAIFKERPNDIASDELLEWSEHANLETCRLIIVELYRRRRKS